MALLSGFSGFRRLECAVEIAEHRVRTKQQYNPTNKSHKQLEFLIITNNEEFQLYRNAVSPGFN